MVYMHSLPLMSHILFMIQFEIWDYVNHGKTWLFTFFYEQLKHSPGYRSLSSVCTGLSLISMNFNFCTKWFNWDCPMCFDSFILSPVIVDKSDKHYLFVSNLFSPHTVHHFIFVFLASYFMTWFKLKATVNRHVFTCQRILSFSFLRETQLVCWFN